MYFCGLRDAARGTGAAHSIDALQRPQYGCERYVFVSRVLLELPYFHYGFPMFGIIMDISPFLTSYFPFAHTSFYTPRCSTCTDWAVGETRAFGPIQHRIERYVKFVIFIKDF